MEASHELDLSQLSLSSQPTPALRITSIRNTDQASGSELWRDDGWDCKGSGTVSRTVQVSSAVLLSRCVVREFEFATARGATALRLEERFWLHDQLVSTEHYAFGMAFPNSTHTWSTSMVDETPDGRRLDPAAVSGHVVVEALFFDGDNALCRIVMRVLYV